MTQSVKQNEDYLIEQEQRFECLKLALETAKVSGVLKEPQKADQEIVRFAKRYWKFIKIDPLAQKDDGAATEEKAE